MTAPVETLKWAVLRGEDHSWPWFLYTVAVTVVLFGSGLWYFARSEGATMDKL